MEEKPTESGPEASLSDQGADNGWLTNRESRLRRTVLGLFWLVFGAGWLVVFLAPYFAGPGNRLANLWYPADSTLGYIGAEIQMIEAMERLAPTGEGWLSDWVQRSREETLERCIAIIENSADYLGGEVTRQRLPPGQAESEPEMLLANQVILCGEQGDHERLDAALDELLDVAPDFRDFAAWARHLYGGKPKETGEAFLDEDEFESIGSYWPRWLFEQHYRAAIGDETGEAVIRDWREEQGSGKAVWLIAMLAIEFGLVVAAVGLLGRACFRWKRGDRPAQVERPAFPESMQQGTGIFFAGSLLGWLLYWFLSLFPGVGEAVQYQYLFVMGLPVLVLVAVFGGFDGENKGMWASHLRAGCLAFPVIWLVYGVCFAILDQWAPVDGWLDVWNESERGLTGISALASVVNTVIWAPLFEEMGCRWMLYGGLRRRFGVGASAAASSLVFALMHGYSWEGNVAVFLFGVLLCLLCERSGSWRPGVIVHALTNLGVVLWDGVFFG